MMQWGGVSIWGEPHFHSIWGKAHFRNEHTFGPPQICLRSTPESLARHSQFTIASLATLDLEEEEQLL
jgi:hypothetical protein